MQKWLGIRRFRSASAAKNISPQIKKLVDEDFIAKNNRNAEEFVGNREGKHFSNGKVFSNENKLYRYTYT